MSIRVAIVPHVPLSLGSGGLEIQQDRTITALASSGVEAVKFDPWSKKLDADLMHVFGSFHHQAETVIRAAGSGIPVVVTSMFVRTRSNAAYSAGRLMDRLGLRTLLSVRKQLLHEATRIIALTEAEKQDLVDIFSVDPVKVDVIPNGVDDVFFGADPAPFHQAYGHDKYILCVASVEPNKNQLALIEAVGPTGHPLILIGGAKTSSVQEIADYVSQVEHAVAKFRNVTWIKGMEHTDPLLASAFAGAHVHALVSHAEGQGIVSLEAAAAGANLVMSDLPTLNSAFGRDARYVDPKSIEAIRASVLGAWTAPRGQMYQVYPDSRPPWLIEWSTVGERLKDVYTAALK